jgi:hypothetical protein
MTIPVEQLAALKPAVSKVFITENEINGLCFPDVEKGLVIFGLGYGVDALKTVAWLKEKEVYYWGDIDTHGFAMLDQVRSGWGRIHAVEWLSPDTQEIQDWLLMESYKNDIMGEYSALTCVKKSGLPRRIREKSLTQVEFASVSKLIHYLLLEGPVDGISGLRIPKSF